MKFGENRKQAIKEATVEWIEGRSRVGRVCQTCGKKMRDKENGKCPYHIHHITNVREPPWCIDTPDWNLFIDRLFNGACILLCAVCHDSMHGKGVKCKKPKKPKKSSTTSTLKLC